MNDTPVYSDLACESDALHDAGKSGTEYTVETVGGFTVARLNVLAAAGEKRTKKKIGRYTTLLSAPFDRLDERQSERLSTLLCRELEREIFRLFGGLPRRILIAGLGNRALTADAFGPRAVERLSVTRHLAQTSPKLFAGACKAEVSAVATGVLGQTGIESADFLCGMLRAAASDLLIVLDALAARSTARLGATVQISDSGIFPGSGIGNRRSEISRATMQIPVLAIGIPTVVNAAVLVHDALASADCPAPLCEAAADRIEEKTFFVSPKEIDRITDCGAEIVCAALHKLYLK